MDKPQATIGYDLLYQLMHFEALTWSPVRLTITLPIMMRRAGQSEAAWGAIDAITDLLCERRQINLWLL